MKKLLALALIMSLVPVIKHYNIDGRVITIHHNDVVDIMPLTSTNTTLYDYGSAKTLVVNNNIIFSNVKDYSVE